jgi:hypothetical protein
MAHFMTESDGCQLHFYCRDAETYEALLLVAEKSGAFKRIRHGEEAVADPHPRKLHFYFRGTEVFAVSLDATAHEGGHFSLPEDLLKGLKALFMQWDIPADGKVATAPFGASMLPMLTDF